jgi:D-alanyl-D-alanine carboxypeptidase (penicillin-binding protein 5/6)
MPAARTRPILARVILALALVLPGLASAFDTRARAAYVYDMTTGTVLLAKNPDEPLPPASMSKLMTLNMLFEAIRDGNVRLDDRFNVSDKAAKMALSGGSTMFLTTTDRPTVEELIQGIIVLSGNDACIVVAEGLAGTEAKFAELMTRRGVEIGLTASTFANASGWPAPDHRMSVHDLATLATRLIVEFPEFYGYFAHTEFRWGDRAPDNRFNRNPLLTLGLGADGLKTGHTQEAGYGLVGSAVQGDRRIVFVVTGLETETARAEESQAIANWAFRQFVQKVVARKGAVIVEAPVWLGDAPRVGLVPAEDVSLLIPAVQRDAVAGRVLYDGPLQAPLAEGQQIGTLVVALVGLPETRIPLVADQAVAAAGMVQRLKVAAGVLIDRYVTGEAGQ